MSDESLDESLQSLKARCRRVLAQLDGEIRIEGLREPVEIIRDRWGIPHIYAANQHDLFFAQGVVAAQDRLFQIDLWRRSAVGELAEVFGRPALGADRFARLVAYRGDLEAEWNSYSPDARQIAAAFAAGINAYIEQIGDRLPIEFELLGYRPKKWKPEDCLGRMSGIVMTRNFQQELHRARLIAAVGLEEAHRLAPTDPPVPYAPAEGLDLAGIDPQAILAGYLAATGPLPVARTDDGSNNWVLDGSRSASGKPLLASDPHRTIALPSLRYLVHLNAPGWNVIGSGEPALPGVAIGHNERIAWGFTIIGTDQADIYVEETHPDDATLYRVGHEWQKMEVVRETVRVRGETEPVELELRFTRHGPVLYQDAERRQAYALRWVGSEPGGAAYLGSLAVDRAANWEEFCRALQAWKMPSENMIYADVDGNIGWVAAALTPVRSKSDGLLPVPGAEGRYEWTRFLNVDELPQTFNPPEPIVTANHNILPPGYRHTIAYEWAPPFRYQRIRERLQAKKTFTIDDMKALQHDNVSLPGQRLARLAAQFSSADAEVDAARRRFTQWDGDLSRSSSAGPIYAYWLQELAREVFGPHLPDELMPFVGGQRGVPVLLEALEQPTAEWFGSDPRSARNALLQRTFEAACQKVQAALGADQSAWRWDRLHTVTFRHPLSGLSPQTADLFDRGPIPQAGDGFCPNATRYDDALNGEAQDESADTDASKPETPSPPGGEQHWFPQVSGASYRHIFDLADWDRALATSAPGQSGQPESPHYDDLLELWKNDQYFPLLFSREAVERSAAHHLQLKPA